MFNTLFLPSTNGLCDLEKVKTGFHLVESVGYDMFDLSHASMVETK